MNDLPKRIVSEKTKPLFLGTNGAYLRELKHSMEQLFDEPFVDGALVALVDAYESAYDGTLTNRFPEMGIVVLKRYDIAHVTLAEGKDERGVSLFSVKNPNDDFFNSARIENYSEEHLDRFLHKYCKDQNYAKDLLNHLKNKLEIKRYGGISMINSLKGTQNDN